MSPDARIVSRWATPGDAGEVFSRSIRWQPDGMASPLDIDIPALFDDALG